MLSAITQADRTFQEQGKIHPVKISNPSRYRQKNAIP